MKFRYFFFCLTLFIISCTSKKVVQNQTKPVQPNTTTVQDSKNKKSEPSNSDLGKADCIDKAKIKSYVGCPDTKGEEVCGCNGITYKNACEANKAGVIYHKKGKCIETADM